MPSSSKRGCLILLLLIILFAGIYFYLFRETEEAGPSPRQGSFPPVGNPSTPAPDGASPIRPLPSDPPG